MSGRCYEDFAPGEVIRHALGRTISAADNAWFTLLSVNTDPIHFDAYYAKSRPNMGLVEIRTTGYKQDGTIVMQFRRTILVYRRGHEPKPPAIFESKWE